ncbi:major facilitator superfamily domain-containing protein [Apodospora peruviana]|uniref:Major facilitator superfamily domain-containing protein n=1 Tax=Apodospora peruviana TaxID=516989 RepID=A0AAE0HYD0_9PEZI|nr:major facilitator superfamily domain-containing protein [Apodospora peruviana]
MSISREMNMEKPPHDSGPATNSAHPVHGQKTPKLPDSDPEKLLLPGESASSIPPTANATDDENATGPAVAVGDQEPEVKQKWNESPISIYRICVLMYVFVLLGMSDGATGALLPYLEIYYDISHTLVSLVFLSPFVGYLLAALTNNLIHHYFGQRGVAIIAPTCRLIGFLPMAFHPPYPAIPVIMLFIGFGNGIEDSAWNAWVGNMHKANELLGLLHGAYGLGATIAPLIATAMITKGNLPWYTFFYVMVGLSGTELALTTTAFWRQTAKVHRAATAKATGGKRTTTRTVMRSSITWLVAFFLLGYVGAEVSLGGWIVTFMLDVRHAEPFMAGLTVTFFWLGLTVGRVLLGFVTGRIGEKLAITVYLILSIALQLLYWLVPSFVASAVFVTFLGFFLGPLFPAAIVAATKLLPTDYHVSAIGFAAAFGGGGAALFPFAVGAIAQSKGVFVLQPIALAILIFILFMWFCLPGGLRQGGLERARENREPVGHEIRQGFRMLRKRTGRKEV